MIKKETLLFFIVIALMMIFAGCKKGSTIPVEQAPPPAASVPVHTWEDTDTTSFSEVDLEGDLARQINENLQVLYFEYDSYVLSTESMQKLRVASDFLKEHQQIRIRLDGHADERGTTEYNMALGERRAISVRDVLLRMGIDTRRIETTSFGKERPANPDCDGTNYETSECHSKNRRVEYTVIRR